MIQQCREKLRQSELDPYAITEKSYYPRRSKILDCPGGIVKLIRRDIGRGNNLKTDVMLWLVLKQQIQTGNGAGN